MEHSQHSDKRDKEKFLNMRQLSLEVFHYLDDVSAERLTSPTFKRAC